MDTKSCTDINFIATDADLANRAAAVKALRDMGYADDEITEIAVAQSTDWNAKDFGGGGVKNGPGTTKFVYIGLG